MDIKKLFAGKQNILYQQVNAGNSLLVKETEHYRWFEYGGHSIQSLMDKRSPEKLLMPVAQSFLFFLLLNQQPLKLLNLGLGGASLERSLASIGNLSLTAVEASRPIIDIAKRYFNLPKKVQVTCQKAEAFIKQSAATFDVILCDLFVGETSPDFLFTSGFYAQLKNISAYNTVLMINIRATSNKQLLTLLLKIKKYFPYLAVIEFDDFANIVIVCSLHAIPSRDILQQRFVNCPQLVSTDLDNVINNFCYIPVTH